MSSNGDTSYSAPRLCHLVIAPDFKGYGFNLHTVKEKPGQFIGQVDEGSPADRAKLKQGDRIIEVNGVNIANENHKQVVTRIKAIENETTLLVVDKEADAWYKEHNIVVSSDMNEVIKASSLARKASTVSSEHKSEDRRSVGSVGSGSSAVNSEAAETQDTPDTNKEASDDQYDNINFHTTETLENDKNSRHSHHDHEEEEEEDDLEAKLHAVDGHIYEDDAPTAGKVEEDVVEQHPDTKSDSGDSNSGGASSGGLAPGSDLTRSVSSASSASQKSASATKSPVSTSPSPPSSVGSPSPTPYTAPEIPGLNLNMSAAEMRAYLASKKKADIRHDSMDMKKKHQIIQRL